MIATISPISDWSEETISTLKFADRAKEVMSTVKANEVNASDDALIQKLQKEVQHLKEILSLRRKGNKSDIECQLMDLKNENLKLREIASNAQEVERLKLENKIMRLELQKLRVDGDNSRDRVVDNSELSTDLTNAKLQIQDNKTPNVQISKILPDNNIDLLERWPLWKSYPPCTHCCLEKEDLLKSRENPVLYEEDKEALHKERYQNKSNINPLRKFALRADMDEALTPNKKIYRNKPIVIDSSIPITRK